MKTSTAAFWISISAAFLLSASPQAVAGEKVIYSLCSQADCADGQYPWAGVLRVKDKLYTATSTGGIGNQGTLVGVDIKTGIATVVSGSLANQALAAPIHVSGKLYGTSSEGGTGDEGNGAGTIYAWSAKKGKVEIAYSFCGQSNCTDGASPRGRLLELNGLFYGTTLVGGGPSSCQGPYPGCGTVFSFDPATGAENVVYAFCAKKFCDDGSKPFGDLIAVGGILYGTTFAGGNGNGCSDTGQGCGTVFALDLATGTETVLHTFAGEAADGGAPEAGLVALNGLLYGTTSLGGSSTPCGNDIGCGTVFSIDPASGEEKILHVFKNTPTDGQTPTGDLVVLKGKLYGTTRAGGVNGYGTVFSLNPVNHKETIVYSFCSVTRCNDGAAPYAGLIAEGGKLYGTTEAGGTGDPNFAIGGGTVFAITP